MIDQTFTSVRGLLAATLLAVLPSTAHADAIDGTWCHADGRTMTIEGSVVTIPEGRKIAGNYRRHSYTYAVPVDIDPEGRTVSMVLVDENTIHLLPPDAAGSDAVQIWRRCEMTS